MGIKNGIWKWGREEKKVEEIKYKKKERRKNENKKKTPILTPPFPLTPIPITHYILNTPKSVLGMGALSAADSDSPRT